jgi:hypothetical protein
LPFGLALARLSGSLAVCEGLELLGVRGWAAVIAEPKPAPVRIVERHNVARPLAALAAIRRYRMPPSVAVMFFTTLAPRSRLDLWACHRAPSFSAWEYWGGAVRLVGMPFGPSAQHLSHA